MLPLSSPDWRERLDPAAIARKRTISLNESRKID